MLKPCCCAPQTLIKQGKLAQLQQMYKEWPFFSVTLDMIEMVFAKADPRVAQVCLALAHALGASPRCMGAPKNY